MSGDWAAVGARVARLRSNADMAQSDLGAAMKRAGHKWSQAAVWGVEAGGRKLSLLEAADLAEILGVTLAVLAGLEQEAKRPAPDHRGNVLQAIASLTARQAKKPQHVDAKRDVEPEPAARATPGDLLTLNEAAAMLRKSPAQMRWLRHNGEGPKSAKVGGRVMYRKQDLTAWINKAFEEES